MKWPAPLCAARPAPVPFILHEPRMAKTGCVFFRHYLITSHAIDRYQQRVGGDVASMIADISTAWWFDAGDRTLPRHVCLRVANQERKGGYALCNNNMMFMIEPAGDRHVIVTTLLVDEYSNRSFVINKS